MIEKKSYQDRGWAWIVLFGAFVSHYLTCGFEKGYSILYVEIINKYHTSSALAAGLNGFAAAIRLILAPVAVALCNHYNEQNVVITGGVLCFCGLVISALSDNFYGVAVGYGLIFGFGLTLVYTPSLTICTTYFKKRRSTALGLSLSGAGFAALTVPYLIVFLIEKYAYEGTVLLLGASSLHYCISGALYRDVNKLTQNNDHAAQLITIGQSRSSVNFIRQVKRKFFGYFLSKSRGASCVNTVKDPWMMIFLFSFCLNMMGSAPVTTLLIHHADNLGFDRRLSVQLLAIEGIVQLVIRVFAGFGLDYHRVRPFRGIIWSVTIALSALVILLLAYAENLTTLSVLMSVRGAMLAVYISQQAVITADMCENNPENLNQAIGFTQIGKGVGVLVGSWCAGYIRDATNQYRPAFLFLSLMQFLGSLAAFIAVLNARREKCTCCATAAQDNHGSEIDISAATSFIPKEPEVTTKLDQPYEISCR